MIISLDNNTFASYKIETIQWQSSKVSNYMIYLLLYTLIRKTSFYASALQLKLLLHEYDDDHDHEKLGSTILLNTVLNQQEVCRTAPPNETSADWLHKMIMLLVKSSQRLCCKCNVLKLSKQWQILKQKHSHILIWHLGTVWINNRLSVKWLCINYFYNNR